MLVITELIFLTILVSGCCAVTLDRQLVVNDMMTTIQLFRLGFEKYSANPAIRCILVFVLQSIRDYHAHAEFIFSSIDYPTAMDLYSGYGREINFQARLLVHPSVCNAQRVGPQSNTDSSNDDENAPNDGAESDLNQTIQNWLSRFYTLPVVQEKFQRYYIMKVAILQHAVSLAIRGENLRSTWRSFAVESIAKLPFDRFLAFEAIILSLFLRRQNAIVGVDNDLARVTLNGLWRGIVWTPSINANPQKLRIKELLDHIINPLNYLGQFWFPSTGALYNQVTTNIQIYCHEAVSYARLFSNIATRLIGTDSTPSAGGPIPNLGGPIPIADSFQRVVWIQEFVRQILGKLESEVPRFNVLTPGIDLLRLWSIDEPGRPACVIVQLDLD